MFRRAFPVLALSLALASVGCDGDPPATPDAGGTPDAGAGMRDGAVSDGGPPLCGDGVVEGAETCDDANDDAADGCSDTCAVEDGYGCTGAPSVCATTCGDGIIAGMEACDDSGTDPGDGCSDTCTVEAGYACTGAPSSCATVCGDGIVAGMEMCDDGDTDALDGCSDTCTVETGVTCAGSPSVCTATCGDGVVATIEACDDGDMSDGDGCSMGCEVERGFSCAGEPSVCMTGCGDGIVAGTETCDDGGMSDGDGCSMACATEAGYACSGEPSACLTTCGDGVIAGAETCDDGDVDSGDGCSNVCAPEAGYTCVGAPSVCTSRCGDGVVVGAEVCDDGNISRGDGCDHLCTPEFGFTCAGAPSACTLSETVAQVSLGVDGGCIRTLSGRVACFGVNSQGELGNGTEDIEGHLPTDTGIADATLVVSGEEHHCALRAGGTVWCWGDNSGLQQGVAGAMDQLTPNQIAGLTGITTVAAGYDHNCVIDSGSVLCWGDNDNRQLGRGGAATTDSETPVGVVLPAPATALALGGDHSCALLADATVACWGDDDNGQLGDGASGTDSGVATVVAGLTSVAQIGASANNTCARTTAGAVFCWGDNLDGQIGDGTTTDRDTPTAVTLPAAARDITMGEDFVCALVADGAVYCWGESTDFETGVGSNIDQTSPVAVRGLSGLTIADVEAGGRGACVLTTTGSRRCWGHSEEGQLGIASLNQLDLTSTLTFAGGAPTSLILSQPEYRGQMCALMPDASVECAGTGDSVSTSTVTGSVGVFPGFVEHLGRLTPVPLLAGILSGGLGNSFGCARTSTGVACVGEASQRQLGQDASTIDSPTPVFVMGLGAVDEVEVGSEFACARTGGGVQCWGDNDNFQCGEGSTTTDQGLPVTLMGLSDATDVALGDNHGCALRTGGAVSCWGTDAAGQLGQGTAGADMAAPVTVMGLPAAGADALVVGQNHACVLAGGEVWCWGDNGYGQLGQGTESDSATPLMVPGITDATAVVAGYNYNCALRAGGTVSCWGYGLDGQIGNGGREVTGAPEFLSPVDWVGATGILEIAASNSFTCLRDASGWRCVGFRADGQLGDGTTLTPTSAWPAMTL